MKIKYLQQIDLSAVKRALLGVILLVSFTSSYGMSKADELIGCWEIKSYQSIYNDSLVENLSLGCELSVRVEIAKKKRVRFVFANMNNESVSYKGKLIKLDRNVLHISNNISGKVHLGELEDCIPSWLRQEMRYVFSSVISYKQFDNQLILYYPSSGKTNPEMNKMILVRKK